MSGKIIESKQPDAVDEPVRKEKACRKEDNREEFRRRLESINRRYGRALKKLAE